MKNMVVKEVQDREELKWLVTESLLTAAVAGNNVVDITAVPQGITRSTRTGDRLRIKNVSFQGILYDGSATLNANTGRILLFQWFPKTTPTVADILQVLHPNSPLRMDNVQQYRVYYDQTWTVNTTTSNNWHNFKGSYRPLPKYSNVQFDAASTTGTNKFYVGHIFTSSGVSKVGEFYSRFMVRYYDS